jgi:hypothetical protein
VLTNHYLALTFIGRDGDALEYLRSLTVMARLPHAKTSWVVRMEYLKKRPFGERFN